MTEQNDEKPIILKHDPNVLGRAYAEIARMTAELRDNPRNALHGYGEVRYVNGYIAALLREKLITDEVHKQLEEQIADAVAAHY